MSIVLLLIFLGATYAVFSASQPTVPLVPLIPAPTKIRFFNTSSSAVVIPAMNGVVLQVVDVNDGMGTFGDASPSLSSDIEIPAYNYADPAVGTAGFEKLKPVAVDDIDSAFRTVAVEVSGTADGEPFTARAPLPESAVDGDILMDELVVFISPVSDNVIRVSLRVGYLMEYAATKRYIVAHGQDDVTLA